MCFSRQSDIKNRDYVPCETINDSRNSSGASKLAESRRADDTTLIPILIHVLRISTEWKMRKL